MVPGLTVIPERRSFEQTLQLCQRLGGYMTVPHSRADAARLVDILSTEKEVCGGRQWIGIWDKPEEGNFTDANTGEEVTH